MAKIKYQVCALSAEGSSRVLVEMRAAFPAEGEQNGAPKSQGLLKLVGLEQEAAKDFTLGAVFTVEILKAE